MKIMFFARGKTYSVKYKTLFKVDFSSFFFFVYMRWIFTMNCSLYHILYIKKLYAACALRVKGALFSNLRLPFSFLFSLSRRNCRDLKDCAKYYGNSY